MLPITNITHILEAIKISNESLTIEVVICKNRHSSEIV